MTSLRLCWILVEKPCCVIHVLIKKSFVCFFNKNMSKMFFLLPVVGAKVEKAPKKKRPAAKLGQKAGISKARQALALFTGDFCKKNPGLAKSLKFKWE